MSTGSIKAATPRPSAIGEQRFVLHVGPMKTATTYIQYLLTESRNELKEKGWDYPGHRSNQQHAFYSLCGQDIPWVTERVADRYRKLATELIFCLKEGGNKIVSSEALATLTEKGVQRLFEKIPRPDRIVFTLRPLNSTITSGWQQFLKRGENATLDEFICAIVDKSNIGKQDEISRTYLYGDAIERWYNVLKCPIHIAEIKPSEISADSAWQAFRLACGLPDIAPRDVPISFRNTSLTLEEAELLRRFNNIFLQPKLISPELHTRFVEDCLLREPRPTMGNRKIELTNETLNVIVALENQQRELAYKYATDIT